MNKPAKLTWFPTSSRPPVLARLFTAHSCSFLCSCGLLCGNPFSRLSATRNPRQRADYLALYGTAGSHSPGGPRPQVTCPIHQSLLAALSQEPLGSPPAPRHRAFSSFRPSQESWRNQGDGIGPMGTKSVLGMFSSTSLGVTTA